MARTSTNQQALRDRLRTRGGHLVLDDGNRIALPKAARAQVASVLDAVAAGRDITVVDHERLLTTQQAADLLRVSRPHVVKLVDLGELPHEMVGTHRRLRAGDVLAYRDLRAAERRSKLDELTRHSEELEGGYR